MKKLLLTLTTAAFFTASAFASTQNTESTQTTTTDSVELAASDSSCMNLSEIYSSCGETLGYLLIAAALFGLAVFLVKFIRKYDSDFTKPWIHYLLYLVAFVLLQGVYAAVWFLCLYSNTFMHLTMNPILGALIALAPGIILINAGWGIRMCGMQDNKYKNGNMKIGNVLLAIAWCMVIWTIFIPIVSTILNMIEKYFDFRWYNVLAIVVIYFAMRGFMTYVWGKFLLPKYFRKVGNGTAKLITWALCGFFVSAANSMTAHFDKAAGILFMIIYCLCTLPYIRELVDKTINTRRCKMCHNCNAEETNYFDDGTDVEVSSSKRFISDSSITPRHSGARVSGAYRERESSWLVHRWRTERTCPECGRKWEIKHKKYLKSLGSSTTKHWKEHY